MCFHMRLVPNTQIELEDSNDANRQSNVRDYQNIDVAICKAERGLTIATRKLSDNLNNLDDDICDEVTEQ